MILVYVLAGVFFSLLFLVFVFAPFYLVFQLYLNWATEIKPRLTPRKVFNYALTWFLLTFLACPILLGTPPPFFDVVPVVLFGWIVGLWRLFSGFRFEPVAVLIALVSFALFFVTTHCLLREILKPYGRTWRFAQSARVAGIMLAAAVAGIALLAGIHEIYWAATVKEPWFDGGGTTSRRMQSVNLIRQIGIGIHNYSDTYYQLPAAGDVRADGLLGHSWETRLLPYVEQGALYGTIRLDKPWTNRENRPAFETVLRPFLSPMFQKSELLDDRGYALSSYAVNERLLPVGGEAGTFERVTDGLANTLLLGEVKGNLRAWGDPVNARDPALGINKSPYGFGSYFPGGANFGFCDGTARFLSDTIEPEVILGLATPDGGEEVPP